MARSNKFDDAIKAAQTKLDGAQAVEDLVYAAEGEQSSNFQIAHAAVLAAEKTLNEAIGLKLKAFPAAPTITKGRGKLG